MSSTYGTRQLLFQSFVAGDFLRRFLMSSGEFRDSLSRDMDLCYTFSRKKNDAAIAVLLENGISFSQKVINIPFLMRPFFHKAKRIYMLQVNRNNYDRACYAMYRIEPKMRCTIRQTAY